MALGGASGGNARGIEAGRAFVRLGAKDDLSGQLKGIGAKFAAFGRSVLGLAGVGGILGTVMGSLSFKQTVDDLKDMNDAAKALGITGKQASGLFGVLPGDFKENVEGLTQFSNAIQTALDDTSKTTQLFQGLSISAKDLAGVPLDEQFYRIHEAIRLLPQEQQAYKLGLVGGTDSMKKWLPLLSMTTEELRRNADANALSTSELNQGAESAKQMAKAGKAIESAWQRTAIVVAPLITSIAEGIASAVRPISEYFRDRNFSDIMQEAALRLEKLFLDAKWAGITFVADVTDFFSSSWDAAIAGVKTLMSDLAEFSGREMRRYLAGPLAVLGAINPDLATGLNTALNVLPGGLRADAAAGLAAGNNRRAMARGALNAQRDIELERNADTLNQLFRRIFAGRNQRAFDEIMGMGIGGRPGAAALAGAGSSLGTFGAGSFLTQGFGRQSADNPAKQTVKELQKANVTLKDVVTAVKSSVLRFQ